MPSIVVKVRGPDGADVSDVSVSMDGELLVSGLDGRAIDVDAGAHVFVFERAGSPRVEKKLLIAEGEKNRIVTIELVGPSPPAEQRAEGRPVPWTVYALGGFGLAALGVGATFGTIGLAGRGDLARCAGAHCYDDRDRVARQFLVADVSYAVGAVSLVAAAVLYFTRSPAQRPEAR
jgi:hypothetical protein